MNDTTRHRILLSSKIWASKLPLPRQINYRQLSSAGASVSPCVFDCFAASLSRVFSSTLPALYDVFDRREKRIEAAGMISLFRLSGTTGTRGNGSAAVCPGFHISKAHLLKCGGSLYVIPVYAIHGCCICFPYFTMVAASGTGVQYFMGQYADYLIVRAIQDELTHFYQESVSLFPAASESLFWPRIYDYLFRYISRHGDIYRPCLYDYRF